MSRRVRILVMAACATLAIPACTGSDHVGAAIASTSGLSLEAH